MAFMMVSSFYSRLKISVLVCLYPINVETAQILCGTSHGYRDGLWMIKILKKIGENYVFQLSFLQRYRKANYC